MGYQMLWVEIKALRNEENEIDVQTASHLHELKYDIEYKPILPKERVGMFTRQSYTSQVREDIRQIDTFKATDEERESINNYYKYEYEHLYGFYYELASGEEFSEYIKELVGLTEGYTNIQLTVSTKHTSDEEFRWTMVAQNGKILTETWGYQKDHKVLNYVDGETPDVVLYNVWDEENGQLITKEVSMKEHEELELKEKEEYLKGNKALYQIPDEDEEK